VSKLPKALPNPPQILWLTPQSLGEIFENLRELGAATGRRVEAEGLINKCRARLHKLATESSKLSDRPRVFCMEWLDPVYACGHWTPEEGEDSRRTGRVGPRLRRGAKQILGGSSRL